MSAAERRQKILDEIAAAARLAKRDESGVQLIAVSKTRSSDEIEALIAAGQRDFGESRVQEALSKWPSLIERHPDVRLHLIGRLQSNKAGEAVKLFDVVHSVDRRSLLDALVKEGEKAGCLPRIYVQVNIGEEEQTILNPARTDVSEQVRQELGRVWAQRRNELLDEDCGSEANVRRIVERAHAEGLLPADDEDEDDD